MKPLLYFAYGANRDIGMMRAIINKKNISGQHAILKGYKLYVQKLGQITDQILPTAPIRASPRQILKNIWSNSFESYVIKPGKGEVHGTLWKLTQKDRDQVRRWELIPFGWYEEVHVKVLIEGALIDGTPIKAITERLRGKQEVDREVDGRTYKTYLMPPRKIWDVAIRDRKRGPLP